jgi:hypothetical protein
MAQRTTHSMPSIAPGKELVCSVDERACREGHDTCCPLAVGSFVVRT